MVFGRPREDARSVSWLIVSLNLTGCLTLYDKSLLDDQNQRLSDEVKELRADMQLAWGNALCTDDVRYLVQQVSASCAESLKKTPDKKSAGVCMDSSIGTYLLEADPKGQGRFLSLMGSQRHVVFYTAPSELGLSSRRVQKVAKRLLGEKLLPTTRFLIASESVPNPSPPMIKDKKGKSVRPPSVSAEAAKAEGLRRVNLVADLLQGAKVQPERILKWLFGFPIDSKEFSREEDKPALGESDDYYAGVWVFRVDCGEPLQSDDHSNTSGSATAK